jgi:4-hydroxy-tetrahydrodipicolinate synthase
MIGTADMTGATPLPGGQVTPRDRLAACAGGVVPPICTPLTPSGRVDVDSLRALRAHLLSAGVRGIFALGSTGEASYLTDAARATTVEVLSKEKHDEALLVGLVEPTTNRAVDALDRLVGPDVDAVVVTAPFYARASEREIRRHFEILARRSPVPVLAYDIPGNVGFPLPAAIVRRLITDGTIAGMKDSSPDLARLRALVAATRAATPDVLFFTGSDALLDCALDIGADGAVAGLSNVVPHAFVAAVEAHARGDRDALAAAQAVITALVALYRPTDPDQGRNATEVGAIKSALMLMGLIESDTTSAPMTPTSDRRRDYVRSVLATAGRIEHGGSVPRR